MQVDQLADALHRGDLQAAGAGAVPRYRNCADGQHEHEAEPSSLWSCNGDTMMPYWRACRISSIACCSSTIDNTCRIASISCESRALVAVLYRALQARALGVAGKGTPGHRAGSAIHGTRFSGALFQVQVVQQKPVRLDQLQHHEVAHFRTTDLAVGANSARDGLCRDSPTG